MHVQCSIFIASKSAAQASAFVLRLFCTYLSGSALKRIARCMQSFFFGERRNEIYEIAMQATHRAMASYCIDAVFNAATTATVVIDDDVCPTAKAPRSLRTNMQSHM